MAVHRRVCTCGECLSGLVVLFAPSAVFAQRVDDHGLPVGVGDGNFFPDEAGPAVVGEGVGCHPVGGFGFDACREEDLFDDSATVGPMLGQGLAGPAAGGQDAAAAETEVFAVVSLGRAVPGDQAGARVLGLGAVAEPVGAFGEQGSHLMWSWSRSMCASYAGLGRSSSA